jgi:phage tail protein X
MTRQIEVSREGLMIDQLVVVATGTDEGGTVEATLGLNPGLANRLAGAGHELALAARITTPDPERAPRIIRRIQLWD